MKFIMYCLFLSTLDVQALPKPVPPPFELIFNVQKPTASNKVIISFTGDLLVHEDFYKEIIAQKKQDFSVLWNKTASLLTKADFSQVNLEGPAALGIDHKLKDKGDIGFVYDSKVYSGTNFLFNYHPQIIDAIKNTGFDIVTTANNHTYDRGSIGIDKTIDSFNSKNFLFVGTRKKGSTESLYKITAIKTFKVAWISCTEMLNGFSDKNSQTLLCYDQVTEITDLIKKIKTEKLAELVFVIPHWGEEYQHEPNKDQKKYATIFAEAGADAIIGSHPHVLQPVEKITTKDKREVFVVYSLGNFLAYQKNMDRKASAIVYLEFSKLDTGVPWISNYSYEPTVRVAREILPAATMSDVVTHVEKYLGKYRP